MSVGLTLRRVVIEFAANRNDADTIMAKLDELERIQHETAKR